MTLGLWMFSCATKEIVEQKLPHTSEELRHYLQRHLRANREGCLRFVRHVQWSATMKVTSSTYCPKSTCSASTPLPLGRPSLGASCGDRLKLGRRPGMTMSGFASSPFALPASSEIYSKVQVACAARLRVRRALSKLISMSIRLGKTDPKHNGAPLSGRSR